MFVGLFVICTFGFVDDVMFSRNGAYGTSCVFLSGKDSKLLA